MTEQLERSAVGQKLSRKFIGEVSRNVNLPLEVVESLFQNGWTLEMEANKQTKWVAPWPNESRKF